MSRLTRFRELIAAMNPVARPVESLRHYIAPPGRSVSDEIALRFELEPAAAQVFTGGIGSGKTTEVLRAVERMQSACPDDRVSYIDVTEVHRLDQELSGVLLALAAREVIGSTRYRRDPPAWELILDHFAHGYTEWVPYEPEPEEDESAEPFEQDDAEDEGPPLERVGHPGVLVPPPGPPSTRFKHLVQPLASAIAKRLGPGRRLILAFDGLDRLPAADFVEAVRDDLPALKAAGVGVLVIAPSSVAFSLDRGVLDLFDRAHRRLAFDVDDDGAHAFLAKVITQRAPPDAIAPDAVEVLVRGSGGFLRDLVGLAKNAAEAAYVAAHDTVERSDAETAVDSLGQSLAFGLTDAELKVVRRVHAQRRILVRGARELLLIDRRAVVPYSETRWVVHPALSRVLQATGHLERRAS